MYLNKLVAFRCPRELYNRFKEFCKDKEEIDDLSHGVRIAILKYMREYRKGDKSTW